MTSPSPDSRSELDSLSTISKRYTLLELQYDGTNYKGWQIQPGLSTVQGELLAAITQVSGGHVPTIIGSGRTDTGVHALAQFAKVTWTSQMPCEKLVRALNGTLPRDIRVVSARDCAYNFHPVRDALNKTYRYYFSLGRVAPVLARFVYEQRFALDLEVMQSGAKLFIGKHDFNNFRTAGTPVNSTIREIFKSQIREAHELRYDPLNPIWVYEVQGSGFLKQMVRLMVSTLFELGKGRITEDQIREALIHPIPKRLAAVAPPQGLVLQEVIYKSL